MVKYCIISFYVILSTVGLCYQSLLDEPSIRRYGLKRVVVDKGASERTPFTGGKREVLGNCWKIRVNRQGIVELTGAKLRAAGFPSPLHANNICVYNRNQQVAVWASTGQTDAMADSDVLRFYAEHTQGSHDDHEVYWLAPRAGQALWMEHQLPVAEDAASSPRIAEVVRLPTQELVREEHRLMEYFQPSVDMDHWFTERVNGFAPYEFIIELDQPEPTRPVSVDMRMADYEARIWETEQRTARLSIGGGGTHLAYGGRGLEAETRTLAGALFRDGVNTASLHLPSGASGLLRDLVFTYERPLKPRRATGDLCISTLPGRNRYTFDGFRISDWILDVTQPERPVRLLGSAPVIEGERVLYAVRSESVIKPTIEALPFLREPLSNTRRQADFLIITDLDRFPNALAYAEQRRQRGISTVVADVHQIYREFGHGRTDPAAIRNFIGFAFHHWAEPRPTFALLLGDGTKTPNDPKAVDIVPVKMGPGSYSWTTRDQWFASVDGDDLIPDLALGRLPFTQPAELDAYLAKVQRWEQSPHNSQWKSRSLLVADRPDYAGEFRETLLALQAAHFPGFVTKTAFLEEVSEATAQTRITDAFQNGTGWILYNGHGLSDNWANDNLFTREQAATIRAALPPIVTALACSTGSFQNEDQSISEALISNPHGAVAVLASTSPIANFTSNYIGTGLFRGAFEEAMPTIGEALWQGRRRLAKSSSGSQALQFFQLIGDPTLQINAGEPGQGIQPTPRDPGPEFKVSTSITGNTLTISWPSFPSEQYEIWACSDPDEGFVEKLRRVQSFRSVTETRFALNEVPPGMLRVQLADD